MTFHAVLACQIALALFPGIPHAGSFSDSQAVELAPSDDSDRWHFEFVPYVWLASLDGTIGLDPLPAAQVSADLPEPLVNLDFALADSFTARKGRWAVLSDVTFSKLGVDETVSSSHVKIDSGLWWASLAGGYAVVDAPGGRIELLAGVRYTSLNNDAESDGGVNASNTSNDDWIDPIVGFNASAGLTEPLSAGLLATVGGFGVGSDLTYELWPRVSYAWNEIITLHAGYRLLALDFDSNNVKYDVREAGWLFGVGFKF